MMLLFIILFHYTKFRNKILGEHYYMHVPGINNESASHVQLPHLGSVGEIGARSSHFEEQQAREDEADQRPSRGTSQPKNCLNCEGI